MKGPDPFSCPSWLLQEARRREPEEEVAWDKVIGLHGPRCAWALGEGLWRPQQVDWKQDRHHLRVILTSSAGILNEIIP